MAGCTLPALFGLKARWTKRFLDLCLEHDRHYMLRDVSKWEADLLYLRGLQTRGYGWLVPPVFLAFQSPYAFYLWWKN